MIKALIFGALLLALVWTWFTLEARTLYYPDPNLVTTPKSAGMLFEEVELRSANGNAIYGWYLPASVKKSSYTVLLCHGNAGNISHRLEKTALLQKIGLNVLLFDYQGYGKSQGKPTEKATYEDARAFYSYLTEQRKIPAHQIVFYGESLGAAVAVELATQHEAAALVLESPFTSTIAMGKRVFPWLPVKWMVRYKYDNLAKISRIKTPVLFLHSPDDEIIPYTMSDTLYEAAPNPKWFIQLSGGHNDGYATTGEGYTTAIEEFLKSHGQKR